MEASTPPALDLSAEAKAEGPITESVAFKPTLATPDISKLQGAALAVAGIPILSNLTAAFGIWAPNQAQQDALTDVMNYGWKVALVIGGSDAIVRVARNLNKDKG